MNEISLQHCLDVVEEKKNKADKYNRWDEWESVYADECIQCATDHQQLAESLDEYCRRYNIQRRKL